MLWLSLKLLSGSSIEPIPGSSRNKTSLLHCIRISSRGAETRQPYYTRTYSFRWKIKIAWMSERLVANRTHAFDVEIDWSTKAATKVHSAYEGDEGWGGGGERDHICKSESLNFLRRFSPSKPQDGKLNASKMKQKIPGKNKPRFYAWGTPRICLSPPLCRSCSWFHLYLYETCRVLSKQSNGFTNTTATTTGVVSSVPFSFHVTHPRFPDIAFRASENIHNFLPPCTVLLALPLGIFTVFVSAAPSE